MLKKKEINDGSLLRYVYCNCISLFDVFVEADYKQNYAKKTFIILDYS